MQNLTPEAIPVPKHPSDGRLIKRSALLAFKAIRSLGNQARKAPKALAQATTDIREAWQESAAPNA